METRTAEPTEKQNSHTPTFVVPTKRIKTKRDLLVFQKTGKTYTHLINWIKALNQAVINKANTADCPVSDNSQILIDLIAKISTFVDDTPPVEGSMRFGNSAFRTFHALLKENVAALHKELLASTGKEEAILELAPYLLDSFGNPQRIDYGTGHELHFVIWLYCLHKLGAIQEEDLTCVVLRIFTSYLYLCRKIQQTYGQEPAGSKGVWCLDDHQFIPFIWGAAQLLDHSTITPNDVLNEKIVEDNAQQYLYLGCINHIYKAKTGPFFEHSPDLYNISGAKNWHKINRGMLLKYQDDVLSQWPVMQHVLFGTLFPFS